jgi:hypothetical protein
MLGAALVLLATLPSAAQNRSRFPLPDLSIPGALGVNPHFIAPPPGELERIRKAGFRWIRTDITWSEIERKRGEYDFSGYDRMLAGLRATGVRAILVLDYTNDLYMHAAPATDEERAAFTRWAVATVTRYRNRGVLWEMWNEPNGSFWAPRANAEEYAKLALEVGKAIRRAAPDEWYVGPATSGMDVDFLRKCFDAGLLEYWDAVTVHPYRNSDPESATGEIRAIERLIAAKAPPGKRIPLIDGEWGYSTLYPGINADLQAAYLAREALVGLMNDVGLTIWYDWRDDGTDPKNSEHHFGVLLPNGDPKPPYYELRALAGALDGYRFTMRMDLGTAGDYCLRFARGGSKRLAVWTRASAHTVTIPFAKGSFDVLDATGVRTRAESGPNGLEIALTGHVKYLIPRRGGAGLR